MTLKTECKVIHVLKIQPSTTPVTLLWLPYQWCLDLLQDALKLSDTTINDFIQNILDKVLLLTNVQPVFIQWV